MLVAGNDWISVKITDIRYTLDYLPHVVYMT